MVILVTIVVIIMATTVSMIVYATIILCAFRVLALCYSSSPKKPLSVMLRSWPDMEFIAWQLINTWYFNLSIPYNIAYIGEEGMLFLLLMKAISLNCQKPAKNLLGE